MLVGRMEWSMVSNAVLRSEQLEVCKKYPSEEAFLRMLRKPKPTCSWCFSAGRFLCCVWSGSQIGKVKY